MEEYSKLIHIMDNGYIYFYFEKLLNLLSIIKKNKKYTLETIRKLETKETYEWFKWFDNLFLDDLIKFTHDLYNVQLNGVLSEILQKIYYPAVDEN